MPRALVCLAVLLACDGGPASEPVADAIVPDTELCAPVADWDEDLRALEDDFQAALNARRAAGGRCGDLVFAPAPPVYMDPALRCVARLHTADMIAREYLGEVDPDGLGLAARLAQVDWPATSFAENVGFGYENPGSALSLWTDSPANCWKLYARELTAVGVGVQTGPYAFKDRDPIDGPYWSVVLAAD
jgi:uncharacterized protein YkwD